MKRNIVIGSVVLIAIVVGLFIFQKKTPSQVARPPLSQGNTDVPLQQATPSFGGKSETTLVGVSVCLPHKDTSGPQTMECALGLQTHPDVFYALDISDMQNQNPDPITIIPPVNTKVQVSGYLSPIEELIINFWSKYNVQGIISVTKIEEAK